MQGHHLQIVVAIDNWLEVLFILPQPGLIFSILCKWLVKFVSSPCQLYLIGVHRIIYYIRDTLFKNLFSSFIFNF